jgi:polar amino acid transport system substrate-binding protein
MIPLLRWSALALLLLLAGAPTAPAQAQDTTQALRVATFVLPPYVMKEGDHLTGFSIDLWDRIAERLKVPVTYAEVPDVNRLLEAVRSQNTDVGVSGVFITAERDRTVDFSVSILNAGLQVMVPETGSLQAPTPLTDMLALIFSPSAAIWLGVAFLIIVIPAHFVWLLDRGKEESISPGRSYFPGIFHALVWATTALVSQVQQMPRQWIARVFGLLWMFAGVVFIALYTAQLTATLTVQEIRGTINGPSDLPGKKVATLVGSTSAAFLREIKADVQEYPTVEDMYQALAEKKADAVLFSSPTLLNYAAHEGAGKVKLVGPEFRKSDLGIVLQLNSPLRKKINAVLLQMREDGTYNEIYDKWFGQE